MEIRIPTDLEGERSVLGSTLTDEACAHLVAQCPNSLFTLPEHKKILAAIKQIVDEGQEVSILSLSSYLRNQVNDPSFALEALKKAMMECVTIGSEACDYQISQLRHVAKRRFLMEFGHKCIQRAGDPEFEGDPLDKSAQEMLGAVMGQEQKNLCHIKDLMSEFVDQIEKGPTRMGQDVSRTGFIDLDTQLGGGLGPGELSYVTGRPSSGKTAVAFQVAVNIAKNHGPVLLVSLEVLRSRAAERIISPFSLVPSDVIKTDARGEFISSIGKLSTAAAELSNIPLWIMDRKASLSDIRAAIQTITIQSGKRVRAVIVDRIELITEDRAGKDNENSILSRISRGLKSIATMCETHVMCLVQMNRKCEERIDKRPTLADMRDSGALEQDANIVIGVYRDAYYTKNESDNSGELLILKSMDGPTGKVDLVWQKEYPMYSNLFRGENPCQQRQVSKKMTDPLSEMSEMEYPMTSW